MKIYVHPVLSNQEKKYFSSRCHKDIELSFNDGSDDVSLRQQAEVAIGNFNTDWIVEMRALKTILLDSVGIDNFNHYSWPVECKISVHNLNDFFSVAVAEEVLANVLSIYRQLNALKQAQLKGEWVKDEIRPLKRLVSDAHVLIIGYGHIGHRVAQLLAPFGCHINKFDKEEMRQGGKTNLIDKVSKSNIIISTIPATVDTNKLFDEEVFSAMPSDATFLNVGRGQVVDELALCKKAINNPNFNACLDVTVQEPIDKSSELWLRPNIHLTQHTGGGSSDENYKKIDIYISQIKCLLNLEPLSNTINF